MNPKNEIDLVAEQVEFEATPEPVQKKEAFHITDAKSAEWVVGKMTALDEKEKIVKAQFRAMMKDIENDRKFLEWRFGIELPEWTRGNLPRKKKSIKLLTGTVGFRSLKGGLAVDDKEAIIEWARVNCPAAIKTIEDISKTGLNEYFEKTGDVPDGCILLDASDKFYVKGGG